MEYSIDLPLQDKLTLARLRIAVRRATTGEAYKPRTGNANRALIRKELDSMGCNMISSLDSEQSKRLIRFIDKLPQ